MRKFYALLITSLLSINAYAQCNLYSVSNNTNAGTSILENYISFNGTSTSVGTVTGLDYMWNAVLTYDTQFGKIVGMGSNTSSVDMVFVIDPGTASSTTYTPTYDNMNFVMVGGQLYSVSNNSNGGFAILETYNSSNGTSTLVGTIPGLNYMWDGVLVYDSQTGKIVGMGTNTSNVDKVFVIDPADASATSYTPTYDNMNFVMVGNQLYSVSNNTNSGVSILETYNASNGTSSLVGTVPGLDYMWNGVLDYDSPNGRIVGLGTNTSNVDKVFVINPSDASTTTYTPTYDNMNFVAVPCATSIHNPAPQISFSTTPNPASSNITVNYGNEEIVSIKAISSTGIVIPLVSEGNSVNVSSLNKGLYTLIIQTKNGMNGVSKFVKE